MCWCWPCRSPCISVEEVDPSEKSYYRTRPSSKNDLYAQSTSSKKSKYISSASSMSSDGSSKASSLPKKSSKHHIIQHTTTTTTTTSAVPTRRTPEKAQKKHRSHSITADSPPKRRTETAPDVDKKSSTSKSQRGRNSSTSSSERSSRSKSRRGRNQSTASSQRSSPSKSHRERHPSTASSERTISSKTLYLSKPKSSRGRRDIEMDPAITKKEISESVSSGSSTLVESEEEDISTKNPSSETLLDESKTAPSPTPSLYSQTKHEQKYTTSDERREDSVTVSNIPRAAVRSSPPQRRRHLPIGQSAPAAGAFDPIADMSQTISAVKVNAPVRRQHRSTGHGAQAVTEGVEPFNPLLGMSLKESSVQNVAAGSTDPPSRISHPKLSNGPRSQEEFQQDLSSFVEAMKLNAFYSEGDSYVQQVSDRAAELVKRKATLTSDDDSSCIPDDIAGMARVALYDVVILCDDSGSMQRDKRTPALQEMVRRIAKITGLFETEGIKVRCLNSKEDGGFNNIRTLEEVEAVISKINFSGLYTRIGTSLWDKILKPLVFEKIDSNSLKRPLLVSIITDGEPLGEGPDAFKNTIANCRRELLKRGYDPSLVVFQVNQVGNDIQATKFIHGLLRSRNVHCTSELLDAKLESLKGNNLQLENWLVTRLTQGIFPTPDSDE